MLRVDMKAMPLPSGLRTISRLGSHEWLTNLPTFPKWVASTTI